MATIDTQQISASKFTGNPVSVIVTSATVSDKATFRRVRLKATINGNDFEFSQSVSGSGEDVEFDVSSALRAVSSQYSIAADPLGTTTIAYNAYWLTLTVCDDYMIDGQTFEGVDQHVYPISTSFFVGRLTDRERLSGARPSKYSRKPTTSPEVIFIGSTYIEAGSMANAPEAIRHAVAADSQFTNTYVIPFPQDGYELRFLNSLGIHESLCVRCLKDEETPIETSQYVIARQETLTEFSRGIAKKQNDYEEWKLSSGPLDKAWQQYYIHEVLMAEIAWIKINGLWLPIEILPDDTVQGTNRTSADMLAVEFKIRFGISGSPL